MADAWKQSVKGIPQGAFLLAYYENEPGVAEALLLRTLRPSKLPTDNDVISSMIEYYKDNLKTSGEGSKLDTFTRYEFSFSGLECSILGTFYKDRDKKTYFGADVENFYSAHHYSVIKPNAKVLEMIVNFREGNITGRPTDIEIGKVRYSSSRRFQAQEEKVPVFVNPQDFLGKRTALFGMTRTGKSNTVKKVIQATVSMSNKAPNRLKQPIEGQAEENLDPFTIEGFPKYPVGQIIFDVNGEYANANMQDEGTAIFELYNDQVTRYSVIPKNGFKVMKVNFYQDILSGFELIRKHLERETADYVKSFLSINLEDPNCDDLDSKEKFSAETHFERKRAAYLCCLYQAGFKPPKSFKARFPGNPELNKLAGNIDPKSGISLVSASNWFTAIWDNYESDYFKKYTKGKGHEWASEDLKQLLVFLTRKSKPGGSINVSGFLKLRDIAEQHTDTGDKAFEQEIIDELRNGQIIIVDLSQGNPDIQKLYSELMFRLNSSRLACEVA